MNQWMLFIATVALGLSLNAKQLTTDEIENLKDDLFLLENALQNIESQFHISKSLETYRESYLSQISTKKARISDIGKLSSKLVSAKIVLYGDEHSNLESQKNLIEILRIRASAKGNHYLFIEWIDKKHQASLDAFMKNEISAEELREIIEFDKKWGFNWEKHLEILKVAMRYSYQVMASENKFVKDSMRSVPLRSRDRHVVSNIDKILSSDPKAKVIVSYGEFHLSGGKEDPHLKERLEMLGHKSPLVIYPRSAGKFWDYVDKYKSIDRSKVIQFSKNEYFLYQGLKSKIESALEHYLNAMRKPGAMFLIRTHYKSDFKENSSLWTSCKTSI